jgi:acetyl-CoA carboxylase biotin carboxyl carrier protein
MKVDERAIRKLAELLDETGLAEIEVAEGEQVIRVSKGGVITNGGSASVPHPAAGMESEPTIPGQANLEAPSTVTGEHPGAVTAPMVGTAYMQPEPDSPKFVSKGDTVSEGDTLLIIEAMKVMNPIKAHKSGTVTQILIDNGQPVEFADILMVIE